MSITALMVFIVVSQICIAGYLLYSFNDVERESRKRTADLRAHIDAVVADLESRLRDNRLRDPAEAAPLKRAVG